MAAYYGKDCDSGELFRPYVIAGTEDYKKHMNQYDVIYMDITNFCRPGDYPTDMLHALCGGT